MTITKITTRGYSGPRTQFQYMPPGELTVADETSVGKMTVTQELADYLVGIGIAQVVEDILEAPNPDMRPMPELTGTIDNPDISIEAVYFDAMSRADLIEYALKVGIELPPGYLTKDKLIALITATNE